jgi:hypothetical protein
MPGKPKTQTETAQTETPAAPVVEVKQKAGAGKKAVAPATEAAPVKKAGTKTPALNNTPLTEEGQKTTTPVVTSGSVQKGGKKVAAPKVATENVAAVVEAVATPAQKAGAGKKAAVQKAGAGKKAAAPKVAAGKKAAAPKVAAEAKEDEESSDRHVRSFKVKLPEREDFEGRFTGLTPYQAANKALSKYFRETEQPKTEITFSICESTRKSKKSVYTYTGKREHLNAPVTYTIKGSDGSDRTIVKNFKNSLKKVKKAEVQASA